jgi:MraZ protein
LRFRGIWDHTLDAKNRLTVPSKYRADLADGVVLAKPTDGRRCVQIWRTADFEAMTESVLSGRDPLDPDVQDLERFYQRNSADTELDSAHRVNLGPRFVEHARLSSEVRITGGPGCLEVWDRSASTAYDEDLLADISNISTRLARTP